MLNLVRIAPKADAGCPHTSLRRGTGVHPDEITPRSLPAAHLVEPWSLPVVGVPLTGARARAIRLSHHCERIRTETSEPRDRIAELLESSHSPASDQCKRGGVGFRAADHTLHCSAPRAAAREQPIGASLHWRGHLADRARPSRQRADQPHFLEAPVPIEREVVTNALARRALHRESLPLHRMSRRVGHRSPRDVGRAGIG
jgi:hypothetical protein